MFHHIIQAGEEGKPSYRDINPYLEPNLSNLLLGLPSNPAASRGENKRFSYDKRSRLIQAVRRPVILYLDHLPYTLVRAAAAAPHCDLGKL